MTAPERIRIDPNTVSTEKLLEAYWLAGDLSVLMHSGQRKLREQIHTWRAIDQTNDVDHVAGSMPRVFCVAKAGRFGGTTSMVWILYEIAVWFAETHKRPMQLRYTSAWQKSIDEIIGAVVPQCFETAPDGCRPKYFGKRGPRPAGLYFPEYGPANGTSIALAGMDVNPDATRGQASDGDVVSEAAFVEKLDYVLRSVLYRQYQGRPWARAFVESSAPKDLNTDWERIYIPDCQRRKAFFSATIEDNPLLSRKEKDEFIAAAGGRGDPNCEREYFNVISGDPVLHVVPEFDPTKHVRPVEMPRNAIAITAADPGQTHQFGLVFGYWDFDKAHAVIQDSWAQSNASTRKVACVIAAREFDLWGTWPPHAMKNIPLLSEGRHEGWKDLLKRDRCEHLVEHLHRMAQTPPEQRPHHESRPGKWVTSAPPACFSYFDPDRGFRLNPHVRTSDIDLGFIRDISSEFGIDFEQANKSSPLEVRVNVLRNWHSGGQIVYDPECGIVIEHVRSAKWNKQRTKFDEHPVFGHFDGLAALVYWVPACDMIRNRRPHPPEGLSLAPGADVQGRLPWMPAAPHEVVLERIKNLWLGRGNDRGRIRPYR